jgi:hypothetical protein
VIKKYINNVNIESTNDKQKFDPNNTLYKEAMKSTKHGGGDASLNASFHSRLSATPSAIKIEDNTKGSKSKNQTEKAPAEDIGP